MNYTELKAAVGDFLNRQDLAAVIPTFISLAEAALSRSVRHRKMLERSTAVLDEHFTQLPTDFLEAKNIQLNSSPVTSLSYVTQEQADLLRSGVYQSSGKPVHYTIVGDDIEVVPVPDATYEIEMVYYSRLPALSNSNATNWLLDDHPDAYLYGALLQSAPYLKDDARLATWGQLYAGAVAGLNEESWKAEISGSKLVQKPNVW